MKRVIGVMGQSAGRLPAGIEGARKLGTAIARSGAVLVTGATTGYPLEAARAAAAAGGFVIGISPALDREQHRSQGLPLEPHDVVLFTGMGYAGRNVLNVRACDAVCFVGGSIGSLSEFTLGYDEGKLLGVLTGTGGLADRYAELVTACEKQTGARVLYDADANQLIARLLEACSVRETADGT